MISVSKNYCGVALLFLNKDMKDNSLTAELKSYIIKASSTKELLLSVNNKVSEVLVQNYQNNIHSIYMGIENLFTVSGKFEEFAILGISFIHNESFKLLTPNEYSCNQKIRSYDKEQWFLFNLLYTYNTKHNNFIVDCNTPIKANNLEGALKKLELVKENKLFTRKILSKKKDRMLHDKLVFLGIEDVSIIEENPEINQAFKIYYLELEVFNFRKMSKMCLTKKKLLERCYEAFED